MNKARMWKRYLGVPLLAVLMGMGSAYAASLAKADEKALKDMAIANMAEVEAGKMALQKSQNAEVKAFAQQMVDDHSKGLDEVKSVAQAKGVTLPSEPDAKHKAMAKKLDAMSGEKFDMAYLEMAGVKSHKEAHALVVKTQANAKDADVKGLAAKLQPTIDQHMGHVDKLAANMKDMKSGTAMGSSGTGSTGGSSQMMPKGKDKISTQQQSSGNTDSPANPANPTTNPPK
jgi:putative membrane protein